MSRALVYLIGAPGAGKSTLAAALTAACDRRPTRRGIVRYDILTRAGRDVAAELGARRDQFSGTDALPMQVQPAAVAWITAADLPPLILGEGDRLANVGFLTAAADAGYRPHLVVVDTPAAVLDVRAAARPRQQDPRWRAGRATKVARLAAWADAADVDVAVVDGCADTTATVAALLERLPPLQPLGGT